MTHDWFLRDKLLSFLIIHICSETFSNTSPISLSDNGFINTLSLRDTPGDRAHQARLEDNELLQILSRYNYFHGFVRLHSSWSKIITANIFVQLRPLTQVDITSGLLPTQLPKAKWNNWYKLKLVFCFELFIPGKFYHIGNNPHLHKFIKYS